MVPEIAPHPCWEVWAEHTMRALQQSRSGLAEPRRCTCHKGGWGHHAHQGASAPTSRGSTSWARKLEKGLLPTLGRDPLGGRGAVGREAYTCLP